MSTQTSQRAAAASPTAARPETGEQYDFSNDLVTLFDGRPQEAETIRTMRTHIMARHLEDGRRGLCMCTPNPRSGCTYSASNLAVSMAQIGVSTLLIDGDMRNPGMERFIRPLTPKSGLKAVLSGEQHSLQDVIHEEVLPNLSVLYAGGVADDAQELLGGGRFKDVMDRCLRDFEFTIIDTPAANVCADSLRISSVVGYSIIVARRDVSFVGEVQALARQLEEDGARVIGTVLNET